MDVMGGERRENGGLERKGEGILHGVDGN